MALKLMSETRVTQTGHGYRSPRHPDILSSRPIRLTTGSVAPTLAKGAGRDGTPLGVRA